VVHDGGYRIRVVPDREHHLVYTAVQKYRRDHMLLFHAQAIHGLVLAQQSNCAPPVCPGVRCGSRCLIKNRMHLVSLRTVVLGQFP